MAAFELRLTASRISPSFPGSDHGRLACWDPGKHKAGPLPQASLCALSSCPFCLFPRLLPSVQQLRFVSVLRDDPPFLLQSIPLSLVSPSQLIVCVLAWWGSLLSTLQGSCLVPSNGRAGHVPTDRQYRNSFVDGGHVEDKSTVVNPPYPITCPTAPRFSGLIGLFTGRDKCASDVIFLGCAFMLILEKPLSFLSGKC